MTTPTLPRIWIHTSRGLQVSGRVSDARSGELSGQCMPPPASLPFLHPLLFVPLSLALLPSPPSPLLLHPEGAPIQDQAVLLTGGRSPASKPWGPSPQPAGPARGAPGGRGTWQPWTVCPDSVTSDRPVSLGQALHFLPFQGI